MNNRPTTGQIIGKAHKLCEWLRNGDASTFAGYSTISLAWATEEATKWHVGDTEDLPANSESVMRLIPLRLPAKTMLIETSAKILMADGRAEPGIGFILCHDNMNGEVDFFSFMHLMGRFNFTGGGRIIKHEQDGIPQVSPHIIPHAPKDYVDSIATVSSVVEMVLVLLSCTNIRSVDNVPPEPLNRKRQKAGKPPLFTYKTLHVLSGERNGSHTQQKDDEEARRSPRLHFRRGHVRRISDSQITWVQQCMVGNKRFGVVEKAYAIKHENP